MDKLNLEDDCLIKFGAKWCSPCRMLAPILKEVKNIKICDIDIDEHPELATEYEISALPTLILFKNGQERKRLVGYKSLDIIQKMVDES